MFLYDVLYFSTRSTNTLAHMISLFKKNNKKNSKEIHEVHCEAAIQVKFQILLLQRFCADWRHSQQSESRLYARLTSQGERDKGCLCVRDLQLTCCLFQLSNRSKTSTTRSSFSGESSPMGRFSTSEINSSFVSLPLLINNIHTIL